MNIRSRFLVSCEHHTLLDLSILLSNFLTDTLATSIIIASLVFVWRNEQQLEEKAEKALPGPLEVY
jgi:hypothetical protein